MRFTVLIALLLVAQGFEIIEESERKAQHLADETPYPGPMRGGRATAWVTSTSTAPAGETIALPRFR